MRTEVAIIGAGPAGLLLSHLLALEGIGSVVVETRSREYVESRIRAGILESSTVALLEAAGLGERLRAEGEEHCGIHLQWPGERHHLDFLGLVGRTVWVYGQTELTRARALTAVLREHDGRLADAYSDTALRRVWRSAHFSWWMTTMLHSTGDPFDVQLQLTQLDWVANSTAGATGLAENDTGPPASRAQSSRWASTTARSG